MKTSIAFELKRIFQSTRTWIIMSLVLLFGMILLQDYQPKAKEADHMLSFYGSDAKKMVEAELYSAQRLKELAQKGQYRFPEIRKDEQFDAIIASLNELYSYVEKIDEAYESKDWAAFNLYYSYIWYNYGLSEYRAELSTPNYSIRDPYIKSYVDYIRYLRDERGLPFFETFPNDQERTTVFAEAINFLNYYLTLSDRKYQPLNEYTVNSVTFLYRFLDKYGSILVSLAVIALLYDLVGSDRSTGTIKSLISLPIPRQRYAQSKIVSGLISCLIVLLLPLFGITAVLGITDGFQGIRYPVLAYAKGMTTFKTMENYIQHDLETMGYNRYLGISKFSNYPKDIFTMHPDLGFLELWQFMLLSLLMVILFVLFLAELNQLISTIVKPKMLTLGIMLGIVLIGIGLASALNQSTIGMINPFAYSNPIAVLGGYGTYSYLSGITVLLGYCLILYVMNLNLIRKIDF